ncbi:site-specific integrase [Schleiferiaceae bacterium]|nr:site-specific integrase [Schleiferiaceae bacterium]
MKHKSELEPTITAKSNNQFLITIWYDGIRYRYSTGKAIDLDLKPNSFSINERLPKAKLLCTAFQIEITKGWRPKVKANKPVPSPPTLLEVTKNALDRKLRMEYSNSYKRDLKRVYRLWSKFIYSNDLASQTIKDLDIEVIRRFIFSLNISSKSMLNIKLNMSALLKEESENYSVHLNFSKIRLPRPTQQLHKPFKDVQAVLEEMREFNENLFLCGLLTYCLLLRPHREIRCLRFSDFNPDYTLLSLSGDRVKSKRNRILPVPQVVRDEIQRRAYKAVGPDVNLFSLIDKEHQEDYFKGLWTKFKRQSATIKPEQTLYSLRHSAALKVFEKTGSLLKLQQVLGHSDMKVSLTYLRGLEVKQLDVEDLPEL